MTSKFRFVLVLPSLPAPLDACLIRLILQPSLDGGNGSTNNVTPTTQPHVSNYLLNNVSRVETLSLRLSSLPRSVSLLRVCLAYTLVAIPLTTFASKASELAS